MAIEDLLQILTNGERLTSKFENPIEFVDNLKIELSKNPQLIEYIISQILNRYQTQSNLTNGEIRRKTLQDATYLAISIDYIQNLSKVEFYLDKANEKEIKIGACTLLLNQDEYGPMLNALSNYCNGLRGLQLGMFIFDDVIETPPKRLQ